MPAEESLGDEPWRVDWPNACVWQGDAHGAPAPQSLGGPAPAHGAGGTVGHQRGPAGGSLAGGGGAARLS